MIRILFTLLDLLMAVLLEKTTKKISRNSSLPGSKDGDGIPAAGRTGSSSREPKAKDGRRDSLRKVTVTESGQCGHDLRALRHHWLQTLTGPAMAQPCPAPAAAMGKQRAFAPCSRTGGHGIPSGGCRARESWPDSPEKRAVSAVGATAFDLVRYPG